MSYVSNVLTHWVGRGRSPEDQYTLITQSILRKRELLYSPSRWHFKSKYGGVQNFDIMMVSFADIPFSECAVHCEDFSHFGLSFDKTYLANCLASPVGYVQQPFIYQNYVYIYHVLQGMKSVLDGTDIPEGAKKGTKFDSQAVLQRFQYIMCFLENHSEDEFKYNEPPAKTPLPDQEHFFENRSSLYYQREWRMVLSSSGRGFPWHVTRDGKTYFKFEAQYLKWVIVPREYVRRLRDEHACIFNDYPIGSIPVILAYEDLEFF